MKVLIASILLAAATSVASAQMDPADHSKHHPSGAAESPAPSMPMGGMCMEAMQEQMRAIQGAEDPAERQRLMDEHMKSMDGMMKMMRMMSGMGAS